MTGTLQQTLRAYSSSVNSVVFYPDRHILASASRDLTIKLWETDIPAQQTAIVATQQKIVDYSLPVSLLVLSPDRRLLASASWDKTVNI